MNIIKKKTLDVLHNTWRWTHRDIYEINRIARVHKADDSPDEYLYKDIGCKIRRKFKLSCSPEKYDWESLSKSQQKRVRWWQNFCENFGMWVDSLRWKWEEK